MTVEKGFLRYSWRLKTGYWKLDGASEAAGSTYEIVVDGMTYFDYDGTIQTGDENHDLRH